MPEINSLKLDDQFVVFTLDRNDFALPAGIVERIIRSIYINDIPGTQENMMGVINVHGKAIPVFNIRKIFNLPNREIQLGDLYILAHISGQTISIVVDSVKGMTNRKDQKIISAGKIFPGMEKILEGLIFFEDGMILIYDPEKLFTLENIGKIDMKGLKQKMKEIQEPVNKALQKKSRQQNKTVNEGDIKKKNRKTKRSNKEAKK